MILFSERKRIEQEALNWCMKNNVPNNSFNIITALCSMGYINHPYAILTMGPKPLDCEGIDQNSLKGKSDLKG